MAPEIVIGDVLLACVCEMCSGTGMVETGWDCVTEDGMPFTEQVKCTDCFKASGYVLTEDGYAMCAFFELLLGR